ncbi:hypothetical protein [Pimelobacter simplex]|uniref:hypothetical protein n=1 Tax=Nocardioides simplex TaxID=2045 RepID=UPI003AAE358A
MTTLSTDLLGSLDVDPATGFADDVRVAATGRTFWLDVTAEVAADPLLLAEVPALVDDLPRWEQAARAHLAALLRSDDPGELPGFVAAHLDPDLAPDLDPDGLLRRAEARFRASGDPAELLDRFALKALVVWRGAHGRVEHWLDLTLDAEHSDQVLCLKFGPERTVREVAWES